MFWPAAATLWSMLDLLRIAVGSLLANLRSRRDLALENLALRQQVAVLRRAARKPRLSDTDRLFWVATYAVAAGALAPSLGQEAFRLLLVITSTSPWSVPEILPN